MIRIKAPVSGWREVDRDTALRFARDHYKSLTAVDDKMRYINTNLMDEVQFAEDELRKGTTE